MINTKTKWDNDNAKTLLSRIPIVMQELAHGVTIIHPLHHIDLGIPIQPRSLSSPNIS